MRLAQATVPGTCGTQGRSPLGANIGIKMVLRVFHVDVTQMTSRLHGEGN